MTGSCAISPPAEPATSTRLNYAKRLFAVPISILGQATGQASMPFFARLFGEGRRKDFADTVNGSVYRISAASFLSAAWMMPAALPLIDLVYRRGRFSFHDSQETAVYFFWFALSLALWSAQALYARAFYAAGDTLTPMIASTIIVAASLPVYSAFFHHFGVTGLAMASDIGILMHTVVLAWLLDRKKLVPLGGMPWLELMKTARNRRIRCRGLLFCWDERLPLMAAGRPTCFRLALISVTWLAAVAVGLWLTKSNLPRELRRKKAAAASRTSRCRSQVKREREPLGWNGDSRLARHCLTSSPACATSHSRSVCRNRDTPRTASACRPRRSPIRCDWHRAGWTTPTRMVSTVAMATMYGEATAALSPTSECTFFRAALRTAAYTAARNAEILSGMRLQSRRGTP